MFSELFEFRYCNIHLISRVGSIFIILACNKILVDNFLNTNLLMKKIFSYKKLPEYLQPIYKFFCWTGYSRHPKS